jgi:hypothetical protein
MSNARSLSLDEFLNHQTKNNSGKTPYLRGWRKRNPPRVDICLHKTAKTHAIWQHNLPRVVEVDDKMGGKTLKVWSNAWNCHEDESVLVKQFKRDRDTGERNVPPVICPLCLLQESLRSLYAQGKIGFTEEVFRWVGDDPEESVSLTLGGLLGMYGKDYLSDEEKKATRKAGIRLDEAWRENMVARCNYLFVVVDNDAPEDGVQVAFENTGLGDKVKEVIFDKITAEGEDGNPIQNPYVIRWEHHSNAKEPNKKYKAIAMSAKVAPVKEATLELIEGEAPDVSHLLQKGDVVKLRADLEEHCVLPDPSIIPWDDIFLPSELASDSGDPSDDETDEVPEPAPVNKPVAVARKPVSSASSKAKEAEPEPSQKAPTTRRKKVAPVPEPEPEPEPGAAEELIACEECGHMMSVYDAVCERCGAEYEVEPRPESKPDKPAKPAKPGKKTIPF